MSKELLPEIKPLGIPVIFVTDRQDVEDRVFGLKLGAEDYIVKPFHAMELLARVEVVGRRYARKETEKIIYFKDIAVHTASHQVMKAGTEIMLIPKEYEIRAWENTSWQFHEGVWLDVGHRMENGMEDGNGMS